LHEAPNRVVGWPLNENRFPPDRENRDTRVMLPRARLWVVGVVLVAMVLGCEMPATKHSHALVGKKAPVFAATLLDGRPFELADYLGQKVIILDFWATWCGPCRQALPTLVEVAAEYRERGVEFFAVDIGETPQEVQQFLDDTPLDLTVVMDRQGPVSDLYQVEFMPQTVIIGRDGTVRFVHVGASGDLRSQLTRELDELVAGEQHVGVPARRSNLARPVGWTRRPIQIFPSPGGST
jgi:thiol-disulfide isomerase/thioredoxin